MTEQHFPDEGMTSFDTEGDSRQGAARADGAAQPQGSAAPGADADTDATASGSDPGPDVVADDLTAAQSAVAALTNDLQRLQAEYVNYKRRVDRDRELVLENAKFAILSSLLPVLDAVDRAREHGEVEGGFKAVADALERVVEGQGLVKFGAPGDEFDPRFHEALMHSHSPDVTTTTCQNIVSAGYQIGERVVRPARVTVVDPVEEAPAPAADTEAAGSPDDVESGPQDDS
ncbi:MAG TPA: nucleotide exchange factor GrpE [Nocardioides sp.]|uniref:nucleotide exchange factor GrpE n=1 Tax=Nocardioides sp. TaxID=35761 RepID=UPI002D8093D9|nr:nucleotide exchange factor GrpE [Nocardioides sp.]HET6654159.1 nucleotide exchange factor GrpE [Nocardioides sp.]